MLFRSAVQTAVFSHPRANGPEVGLVGVEPTTSRLSGVRSNQLSYRPKFVYLGFQGL